MRIFALSFAFLSPLYAITLNETVEYAIKNSPEIEINLQKRDIAKAELSKAYGEFLPTLSVSGEFSDQDFKQENSTPSTQDVNYWHREFSIEATQNLFDGMSRYNQIQQNKQELRSKQYLYHNSISDITFELAKLMFEIEHAQNVIDMAKENFNKINEVSDLIRKRVKEGLSKDIDLVQAQGRLSVARTNILESIRELRNLKSKFTQLTGGLSADDLSMPKLATPRYQSYDMLWKEIQEHGVSLRPYHALQKSSFHSYQAQKGSTLPSVDLYAKYKYDKGLSENPAACQKVRNLGLRGKWIVFEGGKQNLESYIHAQKYQQSRLELKKQLQNTAYKAEKSWENYSILTDSLPFLKEHTQSALKTTKSYFDQFLLGQKSLLDLLDAHNELLRARKSEHYNKMILKHNQLEMSHLSGYILSELGVSSASRAIMSDAELARLEGSFGIFKR